MNPTRKLTCWLASSDGQRDVQSVGLTGRQGFREAYRLISSHAAYAK